MSEGVETSGCINISNAIISDDSMREMIRFSILSQIFDEVYNWCKSKCKYRNSLAKKKKINRLNVFISGRAGVGKSYLTNTIFQIMARTFNLYSGKPEKY